MGEGECDLGFKIVCDGDEVDEYDVVQWKGLVDDWCVQDLYEMGEWVLLKDSYDVVVYLGGQLENWCQEEYYLYDC